MKECLLVIYDLDMSYAERLLASLNRKREFAFQVKQITELKNLDMISGEIDLLLLDENLKEMKIDKKVKKILYLSETSQDADHISRYQSVDDMVSYINSICKSEERTTRQRSCKSGIIGVYSPEGGCGQTNLALELALYIAKQEEDVYLFDFELIPNVASGESADFFYDMHVRLLDGEEGWNHYFSLNEGVYHLKTSIYNCQLWNMKEDDMEYLVHVVKDKEEAAYYIFDIGFMNQAVLSFLNGCDYWMLPYRKGEGESVKIRNLKALIEFCGAEQLLQKVIEVNTQMDCTETFQKLVL